MSSATTFPIGRHYTPRELSRRMVRACLDALPQAAAGLRVLDLACGDGAFLCEAYDELCRRDARSSTVAGRLAILRRQVFGVDVDAQAIGSLRTRLVAQAAAREETAARQIVASNVLAGDALTGPEFGAASEIGPAEADGLFQPQGIDWARDFHDAWQAGGFDLVIGNPPYLREKDAREIFERIGTTSFGSRWREPRMDLWHYFAHRGLDLLREGGLLCFVVNSYWVASRGAGRLIERLRTQTALEEIELLGAARLFAGVSGRHLVFRARKGPPQGTACRVIYTNRTTDATGERAESEFLIPHGELFCDGRIVLVPADRLSSIAAHARPLATEYQIRQGIAENPPRISRRVQRRFGDLWPLDAGVFVLSEAEVRALGPSPAERKLLRPYDQTAALGRYRLAPSATHRLLYLTRETAPTLTELPRIAAHLERFRPILDARREVRRRRCAWWHLHWPRLESLFTRPRVLCVQFGARPQFVWAERPAFVGFSVNLAIPRTDASLPPAALTGILNSELARRWFERHAKRRGARLEINGHLLERFPLPPRDPAREETLSELVARRQSAGDESSDVSGIEQQIEALVGALYR
ncbi:MAG: Eco57I restriction-modification methylase domain-containing protein [Planctomycetaceae bacterium]